MQNFEPSRQVEVGLLDREVLLAQRRFGQGVELLAVEPVEVGGGAFDTAVDPVPGDLELGALEPQLLGVLLDPLDLRRRLGVAAQLQGDHQLPEPSARAGVGHSNCGVVRTERNDRRQVEVGALPEVRDHGAEYRQLLVGGAAVDVDRAQQRARDRLDQVGTNQQWHPADLSVTPRSRRRASRARGLRDSRPSMSPTCGEPVGPHVR